MEDNTHLAMEVAEAREDAELWKSKYCKLVNAFNNLSREYDRADGFIKNAFAEADVPDDTPIEMIVNVVRGLQAEVNTQTKLLTEARETVQEVVNSWTTQFERQGHLAPKWCRDARALLTQLEANQGAKDSPETTP